MTFPSVLALALALALATAGAPEAPRWTVSVSDKGSLGSRGGRPPGAADEKSALEGAARLAVVRSFERIGRTAPAPDALLSEAARLLAARALLVGPEDASELLTVADALSAVGAWDPLPRVLIVRADLRRAALATFEGRRELAAEPASHFGLGVIETDRWVVVAALLTERRVELDPFPRHLSEVGVTRTVCGRMRGLAHPRLYVTRPSGHVERLFVRTEADRVCATVPFRSAGRHTIELVGSDRTGPRVGALFDVDVGPHAPRRARSRPGEPICAAEARPALVARVNALRSASGLRPVRRDPALDGVAQAYAGRMVRERFFGHVAPEGDALPDRLRAAGEGFAAAGENLAFAAGPLSAQRAIEQSPGHRSNLLEPRFQRIGIGAVSRPTPTGARECVIVQVLAGNGEEEPSGILTHEPLKSRPWTTEPP